jgi:methionyl-tRNA formyltransferase
MDNQVKIVLIGGLTNGKIVYDYFKKNKFVDLSLTITYADSLSNKPRFSPFENDENIIKTDFANNHIDKIKSIQPDYIFVVGWSELLSDELLQIPKKGTIGFHPSILPQDRGRSVIAWQLEEGYQESGVTMFYYNNIADAGDIIGIEKYKVEETDYVNDLLDKCDLAIYSLIHAYFPLLRNGLAPRRIQDLNDGNFRRLRKDIDSIINWHSTSKAIYDKIRAVSKPYPGAFFYENNHKIIAWSAEIVEGFAFGISQEPGTKICEFYDNSLLYRTRDGFIRIKSWEKI